MAGDAGKLLHLQKLSCPLCHVAVRGAVKAIAADALLLVEFVGQRVEIGTLGQGLVKGGVEDHYLRHLREVLAGGANPRQVRRVVQGRQRRTVLDTPFDLRGDQLRREEALAAVGNAVAYGLYRIDLTQYLAHPLHGLAVVARHHLAPLFPHYQLRPHLADALYQARLYPLLPIEETEFERRGAAVDHQYHADNPRAAARSSMKVQAA